MNSPKPFGIASLGDGIVERDDLVGSKPRCLVDRLRDKALTIESFFCPSHKEGSREVQAVKPSKIEVGPIHQVNGASFPEKLVEDIDLVNLSPSDDHHCGNAAAKIQQSMQFDGRFFAPKLRPRKKRQAEIDCGGVQRVNGLIEFDTERLVSVEVAC